VHFQNDNHQKKNDQEKDETEHWYKLYHKQSTIEVDFTENDNWEPDSRKNKLHRFLPNPAPRWGPLGRAGKRARPALENGDQFSNNNKQVKDDEDT